MATSNDIFLNNDNRRNRKNKKRNNDLQTRNLWKQNRNLELNVTSTGWVPLKNYGLPSLTFHCLVDSNVHVIGYIYTVSFWEWQPHLPTGVSLENPVHTAFNVQEESSMYSLPATKIPLCSTKYFLPCGNMMCSVRVAWLVTHSNSN